MRAHLAAAEKGRTGHNYILGGTEASYAEIVQMVGKLLGQPTNTGVGRPPVLRGAGRVSEWISMITGKEPRISAESAAIVSGNIICRSDKEIHELDYRPASLETMFRDCIDWLIAEDLIHPGGLANRAPSPGNRKTTEHSSHNAVIHARRHKPA